MSNLDSVLELDGLAFANPDIMPGTESVTYTPKGGTARTINAVVFRLPPEQLERGTAAVAEIFIPYSAVTTLGITSVNQGQGGDKVTLADRLGGATREWSVVDIIAHDRGGWHLRLR